jgi:tetratricopeptide (TPR) repeat protein
MVGGIATRLGKTELAVEAFGNAVALDPTDAAARSNLGSAHRNQGNLEDAIACFRRALELDPDLAETRNNLGHALASQGNLEDAIACFRRALEIKPDMVETLSALGHALGRQGELEEAIACFRRALEIKPNYAPAHINLGHAFAGQGKLDEAGGCYTRAIKSKPDDAEAHYGLGNVFRDQGIPDKAIACYRRCIEIDPGNARVHNDLGNLFNDQESRDAAVACFQRAIEINPTYPEAHNNLGIVRKNQGNSKEAAACYNRAIEIKPDYAEAYNNLGNVFKDDENPDEAAACYRHATEIRPHFAEAHCNLARVHTFVPGDPEIEVLKDLFERENMSTENKTHLLFALGKAHDEIGEYTEASSYYERANKDMAGRMSYDLPAHRKGIQDVKKAFREPCAAEDPKEGEPTPIFVVGMSRSGKTLVESLLSQHADVYGAGESREWTGAMRKVLDTNAITGPFPTYMDSLTGAHIREIGEIYVKGVSKLSRDARFFIDTMPGNYPYLGLIFQALPWAKVIYCQRDPLDNCLFVYFQRYNARHGYSYDLENTAAYYGDYQDVMTHWQQLYGDRILGVRYEKLVGNPADSAERIHEYCGLAYDPEAIRANFRTDEIGHWNHYEPYLGALRQALGLAP